MATCLFWTYTVWHCYICPRGLCWPLQFVLSQELEPFPALALQQVPAHSSPIFAGTNLLAKLCSNCVPILQHDVVAGKAALKKVVAKPVQRSEAESALEAKLREGIAKFRFDDTAGHSGLNDNDHSNNFSP